MYVHARVRAGAKKEEVEETGSNRLRIAVREPAEQNLANRRIIELVARHYRVMPGRVRLVSGHRSPSKILSVDADI